MCLESYFIYFTSAREHWLYKRNMIRTYRGISLFPRAPISAGSQCQCSLHSARGLYFCVLLNLLMYSARKAFCKVRSGFWKYEFWYKFLIYVCCFFMCIYLYIINFHTIVRPNTVLSCVTENMFQIWKVENDFFLLTLLKMGNV